MDNPPALNLPNDFPASMLKLCQILHSLDDAANLSKVSPIRVDMLRDKYLCLPACQRRLERRLQRAVTDGAWTTTYPTERISNMICDCADERPIWTLGGIMHVSYSFESPAAFYLSTRQALKLISKWDLKAACFIRAESETMPQISRTLARREVIQSAADVSSPAPRKGGHVDRLICRSPYALRV